jgi:hypothetical protein
MLRMSTAESEATAAPLVVIELSNSKQNVAERAVMGSGIKKDSLITKLLVYACQQQA